jgi:tetratricopeptide (TPR) repeat protein
MQKKKNKLQLRENNGVSTLLIGTILITLYFNPSIMDPFNAPKMWILITLASWQFGFLFKSRLIFNENKNIRITYYLTIGFCIFLIFAAILSESKYRAIFGDNLRNNGLLTYLSLAVVFLSAASFVRYKHIRKIYGAAFVTCMLLTSYGVLQTLGHDFVKWNNPYNSVISTVGNPNFAAAIMAVIATIVFGPVIDGSKKLFIRIGALGLVLVTFWTIYRSNARQGLISLFIGIGLYIIIVIYIKNKLIGKITFACFGIFSVLGILGMLQVGPLEKYLYKGSVSIRGFYWRAGIEMLKNNLFFGVGIDNYGSYFKQYREKQYSLNYGFDITSSNAHNVPIQIFSTGGIFVGILYLSILFYIFYRGLYLLKNSSGLERLFGANIFCAWIAFQAQSIISIDNIGIAIWGWLLGGTVIGLSTLNTETNSGMHNSNSKSSINTLQPLISGTATIIAIILCSLLFHGESNMFKLRSNFNPSITTQSPAFAQLADETLKLYLIDPYYKYGVATWIAATGGSNEIIGEQEIISLLKKDSKNLEYLNRLAMLYEKTGKYNDSISIREKISVLDPWNAKNYLNLGLNYKAINNLDRMNEMLNKIESFAPNTPEATSARIQLKI